MEQIWRCLYISIDIKTEGARKEGGCSYGDGFISAALHGSLRFRNTKPKAYPSMLVRHPIQQRASKASSGSPDPRSGSPDPQRQSSIPHLPIIWESSSWGGPGELEAAHHLRHDSSWIEYIFCHISDAALLSIMALAAAILVLLIALVKHAHAMGPHERHVHHVGQMLLGFVSMLRSCRSTACHAWPTHISDSDLLTFSPATFCPSL